jgi:hypothetical protein
MMKSHLYSFAALLTIQLLTTISFAQTQGRAKMTPAEILAVIKPGQWMHLEGVIQKDFSVMCTEARIITGDIPENKWSITTVARSIDPAKKELKMLRLLIKTQMDTEFESKTNFTFKSFADLKAGMFLEVDGTYLKDDTFLAVEIEDISTELVADPSLENQVELDGKVEKVDIPKLTVTLMGVTFHIVDKTRLKSAIK